VLDTDTEVAEVESVDRSYFGMIPHVVIDSDLSCEAFRLYCVYKMVCGEGADGRCWMSRSTLGRKCRLSANTITAARRELEAAGLITIKKARWRDGGVRVVVQLVNVWDKAPVCTDVQVGSTKAPGTANVSTPAQDLLPNKNQSNKNQDTTTPTSSSSSRVVESQTTILRRPAASSERSTSGPSIPLGGTNSTEANMAGFDLDEAPATARSTETQVSTFDECAAKRLMDAIAKKLRLLRRPRMEVWVKDVAKFRRINQVSEEDFNERLTWYIEHIDDDFLPSVHSAKSFCDKIDQIGAAMCRSTPAKKNGSLDIEGTIERMRRKGLMT
jgi:hypothetical protein